jgi:cytoskeleton protein RodZ
MEQKRSASFGGYLKTVRLEKGIKLSTISRQTRISKVTLAALEAEDHAHLPAEVFVKGFIRAYAKVVGADGDVAVKGFNESRRLLEESGGHRKDETRPRSKTAARLLIFLGIFVVIAIVVFFVLQPAKPVKTVQPTLPPQSSETSAVKVIPPVVKAKPEQASPKAQPEPLSSPVPEMNPAPVEKTETRPAGPMGAAATKEVAAPAKQRLHIQVVEKTWLKVIVDSLKTNEYSLAPGDSLELAADKEFNLLIGNATGILLTFNGKPVPVLGKSGQVVTIQLP